MSRLLVAVLLSALFVSSVAFAQPNQPPSNDGSCDQAAETCEFIIFDPLDIDGTGMAPGGKIFRTRQGASFNHRAQLKRSFSPELESSLADSALDP